MITGHRHMSSIQLVLIFHCPLFRSCMYMNRKIYRQSPIFSSVTKKSILANFMQILIFSIFLKYLFTKMRFSVIKDINIKTIFKINKKGWKQLKKYFDQLSYACSTQKLLKYTTGRGVSMIIWSALKYTDNKILSLMSGKNVILLIHHK